ncbi:MAG: SpoIIE family protein phosphatase [Bacteroidales bacterium]|nr:SpoIIE family protein phosphatase [Bacteroidales bacterium]
MKKKRTTIFRQLISNVVIPAVIALLVLAVINYQNTKRILVESNTNKNSIISDEITKVLEFQDVAFEILETGLTEKMQEISTRLVNEIFKSTREIETADLNQIRKQLGMDPALEDIYVINQEGVVIKSTFEDDEGLNLFDFGEEHKNYLLSVLEGGRFVNERFTIENKTKRPKKYTYQPTLDGKYIIELGLYSNTADEIISFIEKTKADITTKQGNIIDVELFYMADQPFSLNQNVLIKEEHDNILMDRFQNKDTGTILERSGKQWLHYQYMYMARENTNLYKGSVIRIISDRTMERVLLRRELIKFLAIFGLTLIVMVALTYEKTKIITKPIKKLADNVLRITDGNLNERAEVIGNNEITDLSIQFNHMIEQLESYTNELEDKVRERTAEIMQQKEEIEAQRDSIEEQRNILADRNEELKNAYFEIEEQQRHITDSIHYAKRIQTAILPPGRYVNNLLKNNFILYLPKDIVSGDFYWVDKKEDLIMVAAVDCTGHGVPGAFMSIVGFNQLNYAVNVKKARKASDILDELNFGVTKTLREDQGPTSIRDGMDLALCTIDLKKKKLQFAGALNPLILIRDGELIQYKGDKIPIGTSIQGELSKYTNHLIDLKDGDCLYMFSDGYADQFGGPDNKKFLSKRFKDLLFEIHDKPLDKQHQILVKIFEDWKGDEEQVDDIIVMGIKI